MARHSFRLLLAPALAALWLILSQSPGAALRLPDYDAAVLAEWQARYPRGILSNYREVILPRLDPADRKRLEGTRFEFPYRLQGREPFGFAADTAGRTIYMSIQSLKFLDDLSLAAAWLDRSGYTLQSLTNYLAMIRHWSRPEAPPGVLPALCIPEDALQNREVDTLSQKTFSTAIFFVMLHEIGHIVLGHGGYEGISREAARKAEADADAFALKIMARVGDPPLGVVNLFLIMAYLTESPDHYTSAPVSPQQLAARTHPLSPHRLNDFADTLARTAADYSRLGLTRAQVVATAGEVRIVAANLSGIRGLTPLIGRATTPQDLGPMRPGDKLGKPCRTAPDQSTAAAGAFAGRFAGTIIINNVEFDMQAEMTRSGNRVTGRSSAGAGVSILEGVVEGDSLHYRWVLGPDKGRGILTHAEGRYSGTWGSQDSTDDGGTVTLRPE
ncbi:MAG: hypothetical protein AAGL24_11625 [Pseudomonadota bacterium]